MQGFVNKAIQNFVCDTYGDARWAEISRHAETGITHFETLLDYDPVVAERLVSASEHILGQPRSAILEDLGHHLVAHHRNQGIRRLLRFSGAHFADFVLSLDELSDRVHLVVDEISLPHIDVTQTSANQFELTIERQLVGFVWVLIGALRALADDYGALALIEAGEPPDCDRIFLTLANANFAAGKQFDLGNAEVPLAG